MGKTTTEKIKRSPKKTKPGKSDKPTVRQIRTFRSALNFLDSLTNHERLSRVSYDSNNFGLARSTRLLAALGNPHRSFKSVHVAGTKGKGSTCAMLASMLQACGYKVGLYTSPHLLHIRERIMVNGEPISEAEFARAVSAVASITTRARVPKPTYFEVLTVAAFHHFAESGVDVAVVETGLGGRLDATNVIQPMVTAVTSISYDHMAQLGTSLTSIATEKAGIFKKGVPVVSAPQVPKVRTALESVAAGVGSPIRYSNEGVDFSYRFEFSRALGRHSRICLTTPTSRFEHVHVPLYGEHQAINCSVALAVLDVLKTQGFPLDEQAAMQGLARVDLPGRMQLISETPRVLVDGAHNAASIEMLVRAIGQHISYDSMVVILGCSRDKDINGIVRQIQYGADKMIFTGIPSPRSADPAELAAVYTEVSGKTAQVAPDLDTAMRIATSAISREDLICITGSFYLVAEAMRKYTKATQPVPVPIA
ncbi:MAG: bifunctional folylpolyglutamate synthase/dihydrofolate synthase [Phycisphaerae bacterium]|nr:bifunctional folylpolyglutamate synthase/dihydrofolate synthase [Phycisphaerae bacterium]